MTMTAATQTPAGLPSGRSTRESVGHVRPAVIVELRTNSRKQDACATKKRRAGQIDPFKWERRRYNWLHNARKFGLDQRTRKAFVPDKLDRVLPKALKKVLMSLRALPSLEGISAAWRLAVGPELARRSAPFMFKSGVLFVNTAHPIVTMELHRILPVVALKLGPDWGVARIILRVAEAAVIGERRPVIGPDQSPNTGHQSPVRLPNTERSHGADNH